MAIDLVTHGSRAPIKTVTVVNSSVQQEQRTLTLARPHGPLVVDIWEPRFPAAPALPNPEASARLATEAPSILLIHGWGNAGGYWRDTALQLAATARVIVPDLPGTGRSLPVRTPQTMFDQVATLVDLLDILELKRVQVVGHSMGGGDGLAPGGCPADSGRTAGVDLDLLFLKRAAATALPLHYADHLPRHALSPDLAG